MRIMFWATMSLVFLSLVSCAADEAEDEGAPIAPPSSKYAVEVERSVMIPMRDGVHLSTDFYFPGVAKRQNLPAILVRTPYGKNREISADRVNPFEFFSGQGYVVAVQDVRGKFESEGDFSVFSHTLTDFEDTMDYLVAKDWSNGKIGLYGCSYLGEIQIIQATTLHPNLTAMISQAGSGALGGAQGRYRYFGSRYGGVMELAMGAGWFVSSGARDAGNAEVDLASALSSLPLEGLVERVSGLKTDWDFFLTTPMDDNSWERRGFLTEQDQSDVPTLHVNSWYDFGVEDSIANWRHFQETSVTATARDNQYLLIGGGTHCRNERVGAPAFVGERNIGDPRFDYWRTYLAWFDKWLKDAPQSFNNTPKVQYYLLGANEWRASDKFPPSGAKPLNLFLSSKRGANSLSGDGQLLTNSVPEEGQGLDQFQYDPENPVPSLGGPLCCTGNPDAPPGAFDQRPVEARADVLVYETPPLSEPLTVVGPVSVTLFVSSDAPDTDFTAKLVDVRPDGTAYNVQEGIMRARYRDGFDKTTRMESGIIYELTIDLQATANQFKAGHRVRLDISSSSFPRWERNLNTGGRNYDETEGAIAKNKVHFGPQHPSRLTMWVVREG